MSLIELFKRFFSMAPPIATAKPPIPAPKTATPKAKAISANSKIDTRAELSIRKLNEKATRPPRHKSKPVRTTTTQEPEIIVTDEYRLVEQLLQEASPIAFVSGKAGTGKSTLIQYLRTNLKKNVVVLAPTGVAALNIRGATIHSHFRFPHHVLNSEDVKRVEDRRLYKRLDLLIIDEVSMVRGDVIDAIDEFLRLNGKDADLPFGGTQLLLVGDLFQLPPIVTSDEEATLFSRAYTSPYFFSAKSLQKSTLRFVELSKIFRQHDEGFTTLLNAIRTGAQTKEQLAVINTRCLGSSAQPGSAVTLTCTNKIADQTNASKLRELPGEITTLLGRVTGNLELKRTNLPSPLNLELKVGAQVMFTKNSSGWVNGSLGRIVAFKGDTIQVEMLTESPGTVYDVHRLKWDSYKYEYNYDDDRIVASVSGTYEQFPLMLAWAVTIHKSQGKTIEKVHLDLGDGAFASGQVYVALSRTRSLDGISLEREIRQKDIFCDERIKRFYDAIATN